VATTLGIGERALHAWALSHLGLGLKRFLTVRRLHAAIAARLDDSTATWSRIAAWTGYADQSHFVRDCHALLGESPTRFLSRASDRSPNHSSDPEEPSLESGQRPPRSS
jgi:AraC-like DNA-binding protein